MNAKPNGSEVESKRYLVLANDEGTKGVLIPFEFPTDSGTETPNNYQKPIGIAYDHGGDVYGNGFHRNIVGLSIMDSVKESDLVGKLLTLVDATFTDLEQRKAFKNMVSQTVYGFNRNQDEQVRQTYLALKEQ